MLKISSEPDFVMALLPDVSRLHCLLFLSAPDSEADPLLVGYLQKVLPSSVQLLLIYESEKTATLFNQYEVDCIPFFVLLNANLNVWRVLRDASPADFLLLIEETLPLFTTNLELEKTKFNHIFSRILLPDRFLVLELAAPLTTELPLLKNVLERHQLPRKSLTATPFKEEKPITILAHLMRITSASLCAPPIVYVNGQVFSNADEFDKFIDQSSELVQRMRAQEAQRVESLLKKNPVLLLFDSSQNATAGQALGDALRFEKVMFGLLDCAGRPDVVREVEKCISLDHQKWPCVIIEGKAVMPEELPRLRGELKKFVIESPTERAKALIASYPVFLFMKGSPEFPQCGFSRQLADILTKKGVDFGSYNVLADLELRESLKEMSQWKTYPQLYVQGTLIGGLDIIREMDTAGELDGLLQPFTKIK